MSAHANGHAVDEFEKSGEFIRSEPVQRTASEDGSRSSPVTTLEKTTLVKVRSHFLVRDLKDLPHASPSLQTH